MTVIARAKASPTKAFFVRMITRDIALEDCVLDLIDNSVDGAWRLLGGMPMSLDDNQDLSAYEIRIRVSEDCFEIGDNCGGISLDDAVKYAFTFGRRDDDETENFSIGVYGIGMKRAIFKLGDTIDIVSTYEAGGKIESFKVPIKVSSWLERPDEESWDFDIDSSDPLPHVGVLIRVRDLTEDTKSSFASPAFISRLRRTIARDYALHLGRGLNIFLNGERVAGWKIELRESNDFRAMRREYEDVTAKGTVRVEILAGMAAPPPDSLEPADPDERKEDRNGWYVVCNGRIVVAADKTLVTGWGTEGWPIWHPQYYGFIGIAMFTAQDAMLLPITTTKRSVDSTSGIFRRARPAMRDVSKAWIAYTNERKQALDSAKTAENAARPVELKAVKRDQEVSLPRLVPVPTEPVTTISYTMERRRIRDLAVAMESVNLSAREVGRRSFEYSYEDFVGDE